MRKTTVKNLIHLLIISLPMLLLLIACIFPTKQINNTYELETTTTTETETTINFNQIIPIASNLYFDNETNSSYFSSSYSYNMFYGSLNTNLITNHKYILKRNVYSNNESLMKTWITLFYTSQSYLTLSFNSIFTFTNTPQDNFNCRLYIYFNEYEGSETFYLNYQLFDLTQMGLDNISVNDFNSFFPLEYYSYVDSKYITLSSLTITNNIGNQAGQPLQSNETKQPNETILTPFKEFYALEINSWYTEVLNLLNIQLDNNNIVKSYILYYPLWLMWFYLFELIEMIITAVPRIIMRITGKIGGGTDV